MALYSDPPPYRDFNSDKPTLLVCWWMTIFCAFVVLTRISGRFVRSERLFVEDRIAAIGLVPLIARMACLHVVLIHGTNNANFAGVSLSPEDVRNKSLASGLVLAVRILHAATLWVFKLAILEFFGRLTGVSWQRSYDIALIIIRCILGATFVAVVISALAECQPFANYWQVLPDPGGQCRQGYAQLLTVSVCNVMTDMLLVFFPTPIILTSAMTAKRKTQLVLLFSLSLAVIGATLYRVPHVISSGGSQQTRSLLASVELFFATAASNALVLGTFVRDRGTKKRKFKYGSIVDSVGRSSDSRSRRPTMVRHWGSDEDLVRDLGLGVNPELRDVPDTPSSTNHGGDMFYHPAPLARFAGGGDMDNWNFPADRRTSGGTRSESSLLSGRDQVYSSRSNSTLTPRKVSFFDVGGLLSDGFGNDDDQRSARRDSHLSNVDPLSPRNAPSPTMPAGSSGPRRGSTAPIQDLGGLLSLPSPGSAGSGSDAGVGSSSSAQQRARARASNGLGTELAPIPQEPLFESANPDDDDSSSGRRRQRSVDLSHAAASPAFEDSRPLQSQ